MPKIITVTLNTAIDALIRECDYNKFGLDTAYMEMIPAGKGLNVSRALASLSVPSRAFAFVGIRQQQLYDTISYDLCDITYHYVDEDTRTNVTITECKDGQEHHTRQPGYHLNTGDIVALKSYLLGNITVGDYVIMTSSVPTDSPVDIYFDLINYAKNLGAICILDTSGDALMEGIKASPYLIKPNREELSHIYGKPFESLSEIKSYMKTLASKYSIHFILTSLSEEGAILYDSQTGQFTSCEAVKVTAPVITSVGCGDSCLAGFVAGLVQNKPIEDCLKYSMEAGCANLYTKIPGELFLKK